MLLVAIRRAAVFDRGGGAAAPAGGTRSEMPLVCFLVLVVLPPPQSELCGQLPPLACLSCCTALLQTSDRVGVLMGTSLGFYGRVRWSKLREKARGDCHPKIPCELAASRIGTYPERLLSLATIVWPSVSSCAKKPATASMASRPCWSSLVAISANSSASSGLMPNGSNPTSPG